MLGRCQEADAGQVDAEAVDRLHAEGVVRQGVVVGFDPVGELAVKGFQRSEVEFLDEELIANPAENRSIFPLAAASRTAVWRSRQPTRAQMRVISWQL